MKIDDFDFDLPSELIAQHPSPERDLSRLLVLDREDGAIRHLVFRDIAQLLAPQNTLVVNRTRVIPARLRGVREGTEREVELLLIRPAEPGLWLALGRPGRSLKPGSNIRVADGRFTIAVVDKAAGGRLVIRLGDEEAAEVTKAAGEVPLPPYIRRRPETADIDRYQTVFASEDGAIAAPTAGLHFTSNLMEVVRSKGAAIESVILHVGPGTFEPIRTTDPRQHDLAAEYFELDSATAATIRQRRRTGGRTVAVGTTVVRTLESAADRNGDVVQKSGWTEKYIYPPYDFTVVDALVTNFHLPRSTLLLMVAAFAGRERIIRAYETAIVERYRFYSYGDAMMIV